jgi:predicted deacylase
MKRLPLILFLSFLLFSPLAASADQDKVSLQERRTFHFGKAGVRFSNQFPGARLNGCTQIGPDSFQVLIRPENSPINDSPWYAFQVKASRAKTISVRLTYEGGEHRYQPKISLDGEKWTPLPKDRYSHDKKKNTATLTLDVDKKVLWVAARDMIGNKKISSWIDQISRKPFIRKATIGRSIQKKPLILLEIGNRKSRNLVFIISRQHPPEVTGTFGLMAFVEKLSDDSDLSKRFRGKFLVLVVPLVNPDGLEAGHWRHNMGGVDLNRDWKNFRQPETRQVRDLFLKYASRSGAKPYLFLDFHSTKNDIFYTQKDNHPTFPKDFTKNWLGAVEKRFPEYKVRRSGGHDPSTGTSKGWFYEQFKIPAITYEWGDHTDRELIVRITGGATEEMMKLLLDR